MKKSLLFLSILLILSTLFIGCGEKDENRNVSGSATGSNQEIDNNALNAMQDSKLKVEIINQNEISISFSDEINEKLSSTLDGQSTIIHNAIYISLMQSENLYYQIYSSDVDWFITSQKGEAFQYGEKDSPQVVNGKTITWHIKRAGIADAIQECNAYNVKYVDYLEEDGRKLICEGSPCFIQGDTEKSKDGIQIVFMDANTVKIYVSGSEITEHLMKVNSIKFQLYDTEESQQRSLPTLGFKLSNPDIGEQVSLVKYNVNETDKDYFSVSEEVLLGSNGNPVNGKLLQSEEGIIFKLQYEGLYNMMSTLQYCSFADEDGNQFYVAKTGKIQIIEYEYPVIPDDSALAQLDLSFFKRITNNYSTITETYPEYQNLIYDWHEYVDPTTGEKDYIYTAVEEGCYKMSSTPIKVVMIESYDEFGLCNRYAAAIFESEEDALAEISSPISAKEETGMGVIPENLITPEFLIEKYRTTQERESRPDLLLGIQANVLYFGYNVPLVNDELQSECQWFAGLKKLGRTAQICDAEIWNTLLANETFEENFSYQYEEWKGEDTTFTEAEGATRIGMHYIHY